MTDPALKNGYEPADSKIREAIEEADEDADGEMLFRALYDGVSQVAAEATNEAREKQHTLDEGNPVTSQEVHYPRQIEAAVRRAAKATVARERLLSHKAAAKTLLEDA